MGLLKPGMRGLLPICALQCHLTLLMPLRREQHTGTVSFPLPAGPLWHGPGRLA